jgi:mannosyltransferase OCH1-like enzyme
MNKNNRINRIYIFIFIIFLMFLISLIFLCIVLFGNNLDINKVPKIVYLCYKTKDVPSSVIKSWKNLNPDYKIKLYDNQDCENFLLKNYGQKYVDIFNYIKDGPVKGCFFRICIINKNGGVYSDIDVKPVLPIKNFIEKGITFSTCNSMYPRMLNPQFIYSLPNHPVLNRCLQIYEKKYDNKDAYEYWSWSSPHIMVKSFYDLFGEDFELKEGIFENNNNKYQILQEVNPNKEYIAESIYCKYNENIILNNRGIDYDPNNHKFKQKQKSVIPLDIYQTWVTKDLSEKMKESIENLKKENPEFTHHLYDDTDCYNFILENFDKEVADAYDNLIPGAYKADLWRYCILYKKGGIYLDIKYYTVNGFKLIDLTDKEYFVRDIEGSGRGIYNAFMICKPGNPQLLKAINKVVENVKNKDYGKDLFSPTGPTLLRNQFTEEELKLATVNGLGLCDAGDNKSCPTKTCIELNGKAILAIYKEYRTEQHNSNKPGYYSLWESRKIYKD